MYMREEMGPEVAAALDSVNPRFREVLTLAAEGFGLTEISRILHEPVGTVGSRLHRGKNALKKSLASYAARQGYPV